MFWAVQRASTRPTLPVGEDGPETQAPGPQGNGTPFFHEERAAHMERFRWSEISSSPLLISLGDQVRRWKSHSAVGHLCLQWDYSCHFQAFKSSLYPRGEYPAFLVRRSLSVHSPRSKLLLGAPSTPSVAAGLRDAQPPASVLVT